MVTLRRLKAGEGESARRLFAMMTDVFDEAPQVLDVAYVEKLLLRPDFWAIGAFEGEEAIGGITAHTLPMTRAASSEVFIYDLAVRRDRQRRGIGRELVEALRAQAEAEGITNVFVAADDEDAHALDFYRAVGGDAAPVTMFTFERA